MIANVIVHLLNDLPILVDLEALPAAGDRSIRCTNVRTVDGKRPTFVHESHSTFVFPLSTIRLIESPGEARGEASDSPESSAQALAAAVPAPPAMVDEEPDEDLLARIRKF